MGIETKEKILEEIKNASKSNEHNIMGTNESWYNAYYALQQTFTMEQLEEMSYVELIHLITLADKMAEAFY